MASQGRSLSQLLIRALRLWAMLRVTADRQPVSRNGRRTRGCGTSGRPQPFRNVVASPHIYDCGSRLLRPFSGRITRGRSISVIACARESTAYGNHCPDQVAGPRPACPRQPVHRRALRRCHPPRRRPHRSRRPAGRAHRQAHRPLARGQVHRRRAVQPRQDLVGSGQPADLRGELRASPRPSRRVYGVEGPLQPGLLHRRSRGASPLAAGLHRDRLGEHLRAQPVPPADRRAARRLHAELHDHLRPLVPGRSRDRGNTDGHRDPRPSQADGDPDRRHRVRGRDQEERVHGDELPDARRRRPADAQRHQRRAATAMPRSSSACRGPARPPSRPIPSAA